MVPNNESEGLSILDLGVFNFAINGGWASGWSSRNATKELGCKDLVTSNWYRLLAAIIQVDHLHVMLSNGILAEYRQLIDQESLDWTGS